MSDQQPYGESSEVTWALGSTTVYGTLVKPSGRYEPIGERGEGHEALMIATRVRLIGMRGEKGRTLSRDTKLFGRAHSAVAIGAHRTEQGRREQVDEGLTDACGIEALGSGATRRA
jgi:hypothetical protein